MSESTCPAVRERGTASFDVSLCALLLLLILRPNIAISNFDDVISDGVSSSIEFARSCASRFVEKCSFIRGFDDLYKELMYLKFL